MEAHDEKEWGFDVFPVPSRRARRIAGCALKPSRPVSIGIRAGGKEMNEAKSPPPLAGVPPTLKKGISLMVLILYLISHTILSFKYIILSID